MGGDVSKIFDGELDFITDELGVAVGCPECADPFQLIVESTNPDIDFSSLLDKFIQTYFN